MRFNPFRRPSTNEHLKRRQSEAQRLAEHHEQCAIEMRDASEWAQRQETYHRMMAGMYGQRATATE